MAGKVVTLVQDEIEPVITKLGYELADVEYMKKNTGMNLTVFIAAKEPITLSDCEKVHKAIDDLLDELDPTNGAPYTLNVSSLGLDRLFKTTRDYERYLGKAIEVKLYSPIEKKKEFVGTLISVTDEQVIIDEQGSQVKFERNKIAASKPHLNI
jgi:ribosome maturation factor RimP